MSPSPHKGEGRDTSERKPGWHLNRTVTLAEAWGIKPRPKVPAVLTPKPAPRPPYAGYDPKEKLE